jgi:leucyl/phenylalanyl-tRNA---protein transferase
MLPPSLLIRAYQSGYFPMALQDGEIHWFSPDPRGIVPLEAFHVPRRLARVIRTSRFDVRIDQAFRQVMDACADRPDEDEGTWINAEIIESYVQLHRLGLAHSVETWQEERLVGGLYGVSWRGAFFGESMFSRVTDASKVALHALVERLRARGYRLLDVQWVTPHLARFGAIEIPRGRYLELLRQALTVNCSFA